MPTALKFYRIWVAHHKLKGNQLHSLRLITQFIIGVYLQYWLSGKVMSLSNAKQLDIRSFSKEMAEQVISVYSKASRLFMPGVNMIKETSIVSNIGKDWRTTRGKISRAGRRS